MGLALGFLVGLILGAGAVIIVLVPEAREWVKRRFGR
jgi:hypothetical protein